MQQLTTSGGVLAYILVMLPYQASTQNSFLIDVDQVSHHTVTLNHILIKRVNGQWSEGANQEHTNLPGGRRGVVVTRLIRSAKLLYAGPG